MQDIIAILQQVWRGLDQLQVQGVGNAQLLGSCGDGINAAIRGLRQLQAREAAKQEAQEVENG